jgi:hypothetical protein
MNLVDVSSKPDNVTTFTVTCRGKTGLLDRLSWKIRVGPNTNGEIECLAPTVFVERCTGACKLSKAWGEYVSVVTVSLDFI